MSLVYAIIGVCVFFGLIVTFFMAIFYASWLLESVFGDESFTSKDL